MRESKRAAAPSRILNVKALVVFVVGTAALAGALVGLRHLQVRRSFDKMLAQAEAAEAKGSLEDAVKYFKHCVGLRPNDTAIRFRYGRLQAKAAKTPRDKYEAASFLQRLALAEDSEIADFRAAGVLFNEVGKYDDAVATFDRVVAEKPDDAEAKYFLAVATIGLNQLDKAAQEKANRLIDEAIKQDPSLLKAYLFKATLMRRRLGDAAGADDVLNRMISANPQNGEAYAIRAAWRLQAGDPRAGEDIEQAKRLKPDLREIPLLASQFALARQKPDEAEAILVEALKTQPDNIEIYKALGRVRTSNGKADEASKILSVALEKAPDDKDLAWQLADAHVLASHSKEAQEIIDRLREAKFPEEPLQFLEGLNAMRLSKWDDALSLLEKARKGLDPVPELAARNFLALGACYDRINLLNDALRSYESALKISPGWDVARAQVASTKVKLGRVDEAIRDMRTGPAGNALAVQARLRIVSTLQQPEANRNWSDAENLVATAEKQDPGALDTFLLRADLEGARGDYAKAKTVLTEAAAKHPDKVDPWIGLANVATHFGKLDEAADLLKKAKEDKASALSLRLARIDNSVRRGGDKVVAELDELGKGLDALNPREREILHESLATAYMRVGAYDQAGEHLSAIAKLRPDSVRPRAALVELARLKGDDAGQIAAIAELRRVEGERGVAWLLAEARRLIVKAMKTGDRSGLNDARAALGVVNSRRPGDPDLVRLNAEIEELENRGDQAIAQLKLAIDQGSRQPSVVQRYIQLLADQGRFQEADKTIAQIEAKAPLDLQTKRIAAELALRSGNRVRAAELVRAAVPIASADAEAQLWRGQMLLAADTGAAARAEAEASFNQAARLDPKNPLCWLSLLELKNATGRKAEAAAALAKGLEQTTGLRRTLLEAQGNEALGRNDLAKPLFEKALAEAPDNRDVIRSAALFYSKIDQFRTSEALLRKLIAFGPSLTPTEAHAAKVALAGLLGRTGKPSDTKEALDLVDENLKARPGSIRDLRVKIDILAQQPDTRRQAIESLRALSASEPLSTNERIQLAQLFASEKQWDSARAEMRSLLEKTRNEVGVASVYLGMLLERKTAEDLAEADKLVDQILINDPNSPAPAELKARVLVAQGKPEAAVGLIESRVQTQPQLLPASAGVYERLKLYDAAEKAYRKFAESAAVPNAKLVLARYLGRRGRHAEALDICEAARKTNPPDDVASTIILVLDNVKRDKALHGRAKEMLKSILATDPALKSSMLPLMIAVVATRLEQYDEAIAAYREILKDKPGSVGPLNNLAWLLALQGKPDEAMPMISEVVATFGPSPKFLDTRGMVALLQGKVPAAVDDFRDAVAGRPDDLPAVLYHFAAALDANGEKSAAKAALDRGHRLGLNADYLEPVEVPTYEKLVAALKDVK